MLDFIKKIRKATSVDHLLGAKEQIGDGGVPNLVFVQKFGEIDAEQMGDRQIQLVGLVIKQPSVVMTRAPTLQALAHAER